MLAITLTAFVLLQMKHVLVDWFWQPAYECQNKGTYGHWGGIRHAGKNALGTGFCIGLAFGTEPLFALWIGLIDFVVHYHIDFAKMNLNRLLGYDTGNVQFWRLIGFDQFLHQMTYIGLVAFVLYRGGVLG
jgi:hypothetical protein